MPELTKGMMAEGRDCLSKVAAALKENRYFSIDELRAMDEEVKSTRKSIAEATPGDVDSAVSQAVSENSQKRILDAYKNHNRVMHDVMAAKRFSAETDVRIQNSPKKGAYRSLMSRFFSIEGVHNGLDSLENKATGLASRRMETYLSAIKAAEKQNEIPEGSTIKLWNSGNKEFREAVTKESYGENSGNTMAKEFYKIYKTISDLGADRQTELGVDTERHGKGLHNQPDVDQVRLYGGANGSEYIRDLNNYLDFPEVVDKYQKEGLSEAEQAEARAKFVNENYNNIYYEKVRRPGDTGYMEPVGRGRELIFKDAASETAYVEKYGNKDVASIFHQRILLGDSYRETAYRELTSNPIKFLSGEVSRVQEMARGKTDMANDSRQLARVFKEGKLNPHDTMGAAIHRFLRMGESPKIPTIGDLAGTAFVAKTLAGLHTVSPSLESFVAHLSFDKIVGYNLALQAASKLGSAIHMTADIGPIIATGLSHGRNPFSTMASVVDMISSDYRHNTDVLLKTSNVLELMGAEMHRMLPGGVGGATGRMMELNNKIQGWSAIGGLMRTWVSYLHNTDLAENLHKGFDEAAPRFKELIQKYGVTEAEFRALSDVAKSEDGHPTFFTPDMAQYAKGLSDDAREQLQRKLSSYYVGEAANAMMTNTLRTQMALQNPFGANWEKGSIPYELNRILMQFWSWGIWAWKNPAQRVMHGSEDWGSTMKDLAWMMPVGTLLGYTTLSLKSMAIGRQPLSIDKDHIWKTLGHSAAYGGITGPVGDLIFDRWNRYGQGGVLEKSVGPIVGEFQGITEMGKKNYWTLSNAEKTVMNNSPFVNLHMFRLGLQMMGRWKLEEMLNPGHAEKIEKYAEQDGTPYFSWAKPTKFIK